MALQELFARFSNERISFYYFPFMLALYRVLSVFVFRGVDAETMVNVNIIMERIRVALVKQRVN